uniref:Uncharacterized protein n=1 Tax=Pseudomonas marincola TaxID=437900 RepID=A0A653E0J6_9PSED
MQYAPGFELTKNRSTAFQKTRPNSFKAPKHSVKNLNVTRKKDRNRECRCILHAHI